MLKLLERLRRLGLLLRFNSEGPPTFTAHPFLRVHFEKLLGSSARVQVHEAVRSKLARELLPLPGELPTAPVELDRYERLIEMSRLAQTHTRSLRLIPKHLGGYTHLGRVVGDYSRGRRIVSSFSPDGSPENIATTLSNPDRARLAGVWGLFAKHSGDMPVARCAFGVQFRLDREIGDARKLCRGIFNLAELELLAGCFPSVLANANESLKYIQSKADSELVKYHGYLASAVFGLGRPKECFEHFAAARDIEPEPRMYLLHVIREGDCKLMIGDRLGAKKLISESRTLAQARRWSDAVARCDAVLGRCLIPENIDLAAAGPF